MPSCQVLIVEDDLKSAAALRELISNWGYVPSNEPTTAGALRTAIEREPEVILDCISSPAENFALLRELRSQQVNTPVILIADGGSIETAVPALQAEGAS